MSLSLDDFDRIGRRTPHIVDMRPGGRYVMTDLDRVGGVPLLMKELLDGGLLNGEAMTVTGKTVAENLADIQIGDGQDVVLPIDKPLEPTGTLVVLKGNLAPEGCVMKTSGVKKLLFSGPARVFDGE